MNCRDAERNILLRSSGEIGEEQKAGLVEHLAGCEACRAYSVDVSGLRQLMLDAAPDAPDALVAGVLSVRPVRQLDAVRFPWQRQLRWVTLAAAAGLMLFFGVWQAFRGIPGNRVNLDDSRGIRIAAISDFIFVMTHPDGPQELEEGSESSGPAKDFETLAEQILATQGLDMDFAAELGEEVSLLEEHLPTTLQWHNNPGLLSGRYG